MYTINFSRATLCNPDFPGKIAEIADKHRLNHKCIAIEILEDKNLSNEYKKLMQANIVRLREDGFSVLLDDFGGGYTSFADLCNFNVTVVKIDKAITQGAVTKAGLVVLKNILQTAKELGFKTLCEGVENAEQDKIVREAGCDMIQGYYYYRPMSVSKFQELFEKNE